MTDTNVVQLTQPGTFADPLTEVPGRLVVPRSIGTGNAEGGIGAAAFNAQKAWRQHERRNAGHCHGPPKRKTAAATAHVQRPPGSPTAAAVRDVLPMMRLLV